MATGESTAREREEGRGRKPERRRSSPSWLGCPRRRRGWTETPESRPASDGRGREVEDDCVGSRRPRPDSLLQEGEEDTAEPPAAISCFGAAGIGGEARGNGGSAESASGARGNRARSGKTGLWGWGEKERLTVGAHCQRF